MTLINFNAEEAPDSTFTPVPPGKYKVMVQDSEKKPTTDGRGNRLILTFLIVEGPEKGRSVKEGYNYENPSEIAQNIARAQLKQLTIAIFGAPRMIRDSSEFHNKPLFIHVDIKPGKDGYNPSNVIKQYETSTIVQEPLKYDGGGLTIDNDEIPF